MRSRLVRIGQLRGVARIAFAAAAAAAIVRADDGSGPEGLWRAIDPSTGKTGAYVRIYRAGNQLEGRLETIFPEPGDDPNPLCTRCEGERRNQPHRGMVFMWGFVRRGEQFDGGRVLDPDSGRIYHARFWLSKDGEALTLRGYFGIPLLGRSQTWSRVH